MVMVNFNFILISFWIIGFLGIIFLLKLNKHIIISLFIFIFICLFILILLKCNLF
ncbi:hypothetical protein GLOIN_2v1546045 [Rhizophagus irregularis DAOM 181602=DAOM 197198]|uniref:Uncharacterized protein n=1 Tax=Rhizophagus irregularis (strain DAOM 181602 / DAOM 197198 / MUCL 43194) TaxID=747089 RepID=U9SYB0_RHIID|nr:hypothetical protein GLOIN_2v1546045 [Rhizophagus irregularis DAOM 181602=DAOM 197198]POG77609.1 hypothetical protein GLOIN_2v1546045 [Rhizophagus irregularis DAOM 181602=DAOM 197198]|eukprot:XP_025184475.1 hypothetical protein GLOIN_2v1546045 [Rhizophagus irregularis DAOM 181602=DAOM 197198]